MTSFHRRRDVAAEHVVVSDAVRAVPHSASRHPAFPPTPPSPPAERARRTTRSCSRRWCRSCPPPVGRSRVAPGARAVVDDAAEHVRDEVGVSSRPGGRCSRVVLVQDLVLGPGPTIVSTP
jgi:hypothetical protein